MPADTIYLKDYQPPAFTVKETILAIDLYEDHALVTAQLSLQRQHSGPLSLYGDTLELIKIQQNDKELSKENYHLTEDRLTLTNCPDTLTLEIVTRIRPQDNTALSGLYRSNQLFCTQCEAEGFRRITFYPDRPDVLSIFTTRISADKTQYPILLSNGNQVGAGELPDNRHWVEWHDPFKKPSYLFALVAGDLACIKDTFITCSGKSVALSIYVEHGNENKCQHAMTSLKNAMRWDEEHYGREYDLDNFMIVAVSDFNMGAMENKGLNIFNSSYILASPTSATDLDFVGVEEVVGHEYFHNWTGNRITCRDWFQLSLKEGLTVFREQEFSADMNSKAVNRIQDVCVLLNSQFPEDAGTMAHPVRPSSYQEINNFYTSTIYNKGAEVIRMQQTLLGTRGFRRGMDLYFERHDGQAVTIDDFVAAMEDANDIDLSQFKRWYSQAGTPVVEVSSHFENQKLSLTFTQTCPPTPDQPTKEPFHIPIRLALFDDEGQSISLAQDLIELKKGKESFHFTGIETPPRISLLRGFSAPIKLKWKAEDNLLNQTALFDLLRFETDGYAKWHAAQRLALNCITHYFNTDSQTWQFPSELLSAYRHVLVDTNLDPALRAEILVPPGFEEVVADCHNVDVDKVEAARDFFRVHLGKGLFDAAQLTYQTLWQQEDHAMNPRAYARRRLRNVCLWLMSKGDEKRALPLGQEQFSDAQTMTDQLASLALLNNVSDQGIRHNALASFYEQWANEPLVVDKWFAMQSSCELPHTLDQVKHLLTHPDFTFKNPNKVRALVGTFCHTNFRHFHAADGQGYVFLEDILKIVDPLNPQIASRLATPLTRWHRYDPKRRTLIKETLNRLIHCSLSPDLHEMIAKSLAPSSPSK
ncbi:MAG: aminopeptidase N [Legionella sp.]|nr:aminopeptidase N [Legionella sp.]